MTRPSKADIKRELDDLKRDCNTVAERYAWLVGAATGSETALPPSGTEAEWARLVRPDDPEADDQAAEDESRPTSGVAGSYLTDCTLSDSVG